MFPPCHPVPSHSLGALLAALPVLSLLTTRRPSPLNAFLTALNLPDHPALFWIIDWIIVNKSAVKLNAQKGNTKLGMNIIIES